MGVWEHPRQGRRGRVQGIRRSTAAGTKSRWMRRSAPIRILACQKAIDEAGVTPDQGRRHHLLRQPYCRRQQRHRVAVGAAALLCPLRFGVGAHADQRAVARRAAGPHAMSNSRRPACRPSAKWSALASRAVGDDQCSTCLVIYPTGNLEGPLSPRRRERRRLRPRRPPMGGALGQSRRQRFHQHASRTSQYCRKYGGKHDDLAPFVVNQHRNGLLTPWGYNASHRMCRSSR